MNKYKRCWYSVAALLLFAGSLQAQTITVGSTSGVPGGQATVQLDWDDNGNDYRTLQFDVDFDLGVLPSVNTGVCPVEPYITGYLVTTCEQRAAPDDNQVRLGLLLTAGSIPTGNLGQLTFTIDGAATPGVTDLIVTGVVIEGDPTPVINNGQITIQGPAYTSTPTPAQGVDLGSVVQGDTDPTEGVLITNTGAVGTTLTADCFIAVNTGVFSVDSTASFDVAQGSAGVTRVVTCNSDAPIQIQTGVMQCNHNGDDTGEADPARYDLTCNITDGPQPVYNSVPAPGAINMSATEEGDPITPVNIEIDNDSGQVGSSLDGSCVLAGDTQISHTGSAFQISMGGTHSNQIISCSSVDQGNYSATLTCANNDKANPSPVYNISCVVPPAGAAIFRSDPVPGTIDMTAGTGVAQGEAVPDSTLTFFNDALEANDNDLVLFCAEDGAGSPEITVSPNPLDVSIIPGGNSSVTVSCDSADVGSFSKDFNCEYTIDGSSLPSGNGGLGSASYTYTCEVREPESVVVPDPASGTPLITMADPDGSAQLSVVFNETADEGVNGSVDCELAGGEGSDFVIDTDLPADIPAGGSLTVTVTGTDPGTDVDSITDTLNCTYTDSANPDPGVDVTYPLTIEFGGGAAGFAVTKTFADDSDADVTVTLTCNTGLPLQQSFDISPGDPVMFVVTSFEDGLMDCVVSEGDADAYLTHYAASGDSQSADDVPDAPGCHFFAVAGGDSNLCEITNAAEPVDVVIEKEWVIDGAVSDEVNQYYRLTLYCDSLIIGGTPSDGNGNPMSAPQSFVPDHWYKVFNGMGNEIFIAEVVPDYPSTSCWVDEDVSTRSGIEVDNGCMDIEVSAGNGAFCKITNTVFFEGIPTLSQYGLALMALLMLGVGMVGFRRFA